MIKYLILFFAAVVVVQVLSCDSGDDCKQDQCCVTPGGLGLVKYCSPRPKENKFCGLSTIYDEEKEIYKYACPCPEGTTCKLGNQLMDFVLKCRKKEDITERPSNRSYEY
ncbi:U19-ctenitoxin-Pn1a-like isoform X4 [Centruroides vittatus]|uniref:U19-ctenitoxin-Pn1a-like isoform X4 n=1 Tax=Centruroides vittatus TaxID=120091 RepID=UPI00350F1D93